MSVQLTSEFVIKNVGRVALIHRALYGEKSAGKDFRNHLQSCMQHLHFKSCPGDPDVWIWPAQKGDGSPCYHYVLLYTDDTLVISENAESILRDELRCYFQLKVGVHWSSTNLSWRHVQKVTLENGMSTWSFSTTQYMQAAIKNVEAYISNNATGQWKLQAKAETPLRATYRPELDLSPEMGHEDASYYQSLIGILCWIVEFG